MIGSLKRRVYTALDTGLVCNVCIVTLILLNVVAVIVETEGTLSSDFASIFRTFEIFSVVIFTIEYTLRLWTCTINEKYSHPVWGTLGFAFSFLAIVDLVAILPFYIPMLISVDLRFLRALRILRIFRLLKTGRYSESLQLIGRVFKSKKEALIVSVSVAFILLILASSVVYIAEHDAQPEKFSSILSTMWWGVSALTTVGYGDMAPVTGLGKLFGGISAVLGIGLFALPAGILAGGFSEEMRKRGSNKQVCPHCGKVISHPD